LKKNPTFQRQILNSMKPSLLLLLLTPAAAFAQNPVPSTESQLKTAVLAAPADQREEATVLGYTAAGELTKLRKGTNDLICLADDPAQKGFSVSCYHRSLEPFMARGRELRKQGKKQEEIVAIREAEAKRKKLKMPASPATLFVHSAPPENYDPATGEVREGYTRYVVYMPLATAASTGLPLKAEAPGQPWLMDPGTYRAHIMINPPRPK